LGIDHHSSQRDLPGFDRFADYYADAVVELNELPTFEEHLKVALAEIDNLEIRTFLDRLRGLVAFAIANGTQVVALSD